MKNRTRAEVAMALLLEVPNARVLALAACTARAAGGGIEWHCVLPARPEDRAAAAAAAAAANRRIRRWASVRESSHPTAVGKSSDTSRVCGGWTHTDHHPLIQSVLRVSVDGLTCTYTIGQGKTTRVITRRSPVGTQYVPDDLGIAVRRIRDGMDYHPGAEDFLANDFARRIRAGLVRKSAAIREYRRMARARVKGEINAKKARVKWLADAASSRVSLDDSRRAGNCVEGTLKWCELRLGMARDLILGGGHLIHVSAGKLLATGDARAELAVRSAWERETMVSI